MPADRGSEHRDHRDLPPDGAETSAQRMERVRAERDAFRTDPKNWDKLDPTNIPDRRRLHGDPEPWTPEELAKIAAFPGDEWDPPGPAAAAKATDDERATGTSDFSYAELPALRVGKANSVDVAERTDDGGPDWEDFDPERAHADPVYLQNFLRRFVADAAKPLVDRGEVADRPGRTDAGRIERPEQPRNEPAVPWNAPETIDGSGNRGDLPLYDGLPRRDQVRQQNLCDCWLLASIRGVAGHQPQAITDLISQRPNGAFDVRLHQARLDRTSGDWIPTGRRLTAETTREVPVDVNDPDRSWFADTKQAKVAWPAALEKTFAGLEPTWSRARQAATVERGYDRLDQGGDEWQMAESLTQLTGRRAGVIALDRTPGNETAVETTLARHLADGRPVIVGTIQSNAPRNLLPHNLRGGHAYEVTAVHAGRVQLENPWNREHPTLMTVREFLANTRGLAATLKS